MSLLSDVWASFVVLATVAKHLLNYFLKECKFYTDFSSFVLYVKCTTMKILVPSHPPDVVSAAEFSHFLLG